MGTTNDSSGYSRGRPQHRYYPLPVGDRIDVDRFLTLRPQLFAEAMVWYGEHQATWWQEPEDITATAAEERELRRAASDYEQPLHEWLEFERHNEVLYDDGKPVHFTRNETAWPEIARWFLKIVEPERWKDQKPADADSYGAQGARMEVQAHLALWTHHTHLEQGRNH